VTLRAERAAVTRRRIAETARALFARDGYGATTLRDIAHEAGVAVQTVYAVYRSKAGILEELREEAVNQPEAAALFRAAMTEAEPRTRLHLFARSIRQRWERAGDIVAIHQDAATTDRAVRAGVDEAEGIRRDGMRRLAMVLEPALRAGVSTERAGALMDALTLPAVYANLTEVHHWTADEFEAWLTSALIRELLGGEPPA